MTDRYRYIRLFHWLYIFQASSCCTLSAASLPLQTSTWKRARYPCASHTPSPLTLPPSRPLRTARYQLSFATLRHSTTTITSSRFHGTCWVDIRTISFTISAAPLSIATPPSYSKIAKSTVPATWPVRARPPCYTRFPSACILPTRIGGGCKNLYQAAIHVATTSEAKFGQSSNLNKFHS